MTRDGRGRWRLLRWLGLLTRPRLLRPCRPPPCGRCPPRRWCSPLLHRWQALVQRRGPARHADAEAVATCAALVDVLAADLGGRRPARRSSSRWRWTSRTWPGSLAPCALRRAPGARHGGCSGGHSRRAAPPRRRSMRSRAAGRGAWYGRRSASVSAASVPSYARTRNVRVKPSSRSGRGRDEGRRRPSRRRGRRSRGALHLARAAGNRARASVKTLICASTMHGAAAPEQTRDEDGRDEHREDDRTGRRRCRRA